MIVLLTTLIPCICILEERLPHVALDRLDSIQPRSQDPHPHPQYPEGPHLPRHRYRYSRLLRRGDWGLPLPGGLVFQG